MTTYTSELDSPDFWHGREYGITTHDGQTFTPYFSVYVGGEVIKHDRVLDNYPYAIALELAEDHPNAIIKAVAYIQMFGEVQPWVKPTNVAKIRGITPFIFLNGIYAPNAPQNAHSDK